MSEQIVEVIKSEWPDKKRKWYKQSFKEAWLDAPELSPWLQRDDYDPTCGYCRFCDITLKNYNRSMLIKHSNSVKHKKNNNITRASTNDIIARASTDILTKINTGIAQSMLQDQPKVSKEIAKSELFIASYFAKHDLPFSTVDHFLSMCKKVFPDSKIAEKLSNKRMKQNNKDSEGWNLAKNTCGLTFISKPAPDWESTAVIDGQFKQLKLSDYLGKYLVFFFYPLDFTFVCPTEILAFNSRVNEFHALNTEVVACSIDSHFTHLAWTRTPREEGGLGNLQIPLLSDITHSISKDYGVYLDTMGVALRGLFIIDNKGILRQITMNDLPVGRSVDETLRLVQAFQFTDQHGEVCPAGWKPGDATIIPNPEESKEYFKNANREL